MQFFDPVDLDLDCRGSDCQCGFFFRFDKMGMVTTGERVVVGDRGTDQLAFPVYGGTPLDPETGQPINRMVITNSIQNAVPRAVWDLGDRYEFGYWSPEGSGWLFSVLNGPDNVQSFSMGLEDFPIPQDQIDQAIDDNDDDDLTDEEIIADLIAEYDALAEETVFVSFRSSVGAFAGFLDVDEGGLNGIGDGDGFADDIDEDGQHGGQWFDTDGDNIPDTHVNVFPDYGDLVTLTTGFSQVDLKNTLKINGFEMMHAHRLDNDHFLVGKQNNSFEWGYGVRFLQLDDNFIFNGTGGFALGDARWDTTIVNNIVGPQLGFKWKRNRGRWALESDGKFMFGYNVRDWEQTGFAGAGKTQGDVNSFLLSRAKSFSYGQNDDDFAPVGELRMNLKYRLTDNVSFNLGWTGTFVDNIKRASTHVDYVLGDDNGKYMGFKDDGSEEIMANAINIGIEVRQ
ncbi:BBP7 family outer membrane beta-barrel protein [Aeoliella mucimassa]|nr:BBP7 family outer membrane beta-barrel protein [Aeoliella mucimassa]